MLVRVDTSHAAILSRLVGCVCIQRTYRVLASAAIGSTCRRDRTLFRDDRRHEDITVAADRPDDLRFLNTTTIEAFPGTMVVPDISRR
ncbi:hypothetical protein [Sphingomonas sp. NFX23]|uniref:hypothetical protein n=1 Tax=Sphingomonas sp. NFX23 TaxID=2819532 RepID=UPI003CE9B7F8